MSSKKITYLYRTAGLILLPTILFVGWLNWLAISSVQSAPANSGFSGDLNLPDTLTAGEKRSIQVPGRSCYLNVTTSWGNRFFKLRETSFRLPDSLLQEAGLQTYQLICNGKTVATHHLRVLPQPAAEPLASYIGSKSIPADDGRHWAMITAIPADKFKNMQPDSLPVRFNLRHPDGSLENITQYLRNGVAYHKIYSGTVEGKTIIGSEAGEAGGREKELLEMPDHPVSLQIFPKNVYEFADARQFFQLITVPITDAFGNIISNGTLIYFNITEPGGKRRFLTAYTIGGVARIAVQNPSLQGNMQIQATVYGSVESNVLTLNFRPIVTDFGISLKAPAKLIIGPFKEALQQYVTDGAEVSVQCNAFPEPRIGVIENGYAEVDLSDLPAGKYALQLQFGGIEKNATLNLKK